MKKTLSLLSIVLSLILVGMPAYAAKPGSSGGGKGTTATTGVDVSWPQCGVALPSGEPFGIVGVNGGTANKVNPCLADQLNWVSSKMVGGTNQPKAQLYVNTGNPGETMDLITTWPTSNTDQTGYTTANPYGTCTGENTNDLPCSWQYGWNRSVDTVYNMFVPAATSAGVNSDPTTYTWWLDVEIDNSWQSGSNDALARNTATLEGFASYYQSHNIKTGLYSMASMWSQIVGNNVSAKSNLNGLDSWLPGAKSVKAAQSLCGNASLTAGGHVTLTQYVTSGLDHDYSCI